MFEKGSLVGAKDPDLTQRDREKASLIEQDLTDTADPGGAPELAPAVHVHDVDALVAARVGEHMGVRLPGGRDGWHILCEHGIWSSVAGDDVQRGAGAVGDPGIEPAARPPRVRNGLVAGKRPSHLAVVRVERHEPIAFRGDEEEAARRPRGILEVAEESLRAVVSDDPRTCG